jgi:hypothetical protein
MIKRWASIFLVILVAVLILGFLPWGLLEYGGQEISLSPAMKMNAGSAKSQGAQLSAETLGRIRAAQEKIQLTDGHDYSEVYSLLDSKKNSYNEIILICNELEPIYCLKKASEQNLNLREKICAELGKEIDAKYAGKNVNKEEHVRECLAGLPQMSY